MAGQGLAGSILAWYLINANQRVLVVEDVHAPSATEVASGLMHPVTGRRIVKSWRADEFIPKAVDLYQEIELALNTRFYYNTPILEIYHDHGNRNDWMNRSITSGIGEFIGRDYNVEELPKSLKAPYGALALQHTGWLNATQFKKDLKNWLKANNAYAEGTIDYHLLNNNGTLFKFNDYTFDKLIDCRGYYSMKSKSWSYLPFNPAKGEELVFTSEADLWKNYIYHNTFKIIPTNNNEYRFGATYAWNDLSDEITKEAKEKLSNGLNSLLDAPFTIIGQRAGIRPATKDRRPFMGEHPLETNHYIFNGLGSKGVSAAPTLAHEMMQYLLYNIPIQPEYSLERFTFLDY
ncbi:MAG: NAD(P)/FAD-dependent oxidoreductase [Bacteroidota bacterium]